MDFAKVLAEGGRLDFSYVDDRTAALLFGGASHTRVFANIDVLVPRAEQLAAMKIHAIKSDPARTFKELADLQFLLGLPGIDEGEIRSATVEELRARPGPRGEPFRL